jgi:hypothetical protein
MSTSDCRITGNGGFEEERICWLENMCDSRISDSKNYIGTKIVCDSDSREGSSI